MQLRPQYSSPDSSSQLHVLWHCNNPKKKKKCLRGSLHEKLEIVSMSFNTVLLHPHYHSLKWTPDLFPLPSQQMDLNPRVHHDAHCGHMSTYIVIVEQIKSQVFRHDEMSSIIGLGHIARAIKTYTHTHIRAHIHTYIHVLIHMLINGHIHIYIPM